MNLESWIQLELRDVSSRLTSQVLTPVPRDRRDERPGGGNSINWALFHVARHAELALAVLTRRPISRTGAFGLGETEMEGPDRLDAVAVESLARAVLTDAAAFALELTPAGLDAIPDARATLASAGIPHEGFDWLYEQWVGQPAAFFVRWPLTAHATNHIGEMIATRNRLGLSPHRHPPRNRSASGR